MSLFWCFWPVQWCSDLSAQCTASCKACRISRISTAHLSFSRNPTLCWSDWWILMIFHDFRFIPIDSLSHVTWYKTRCGVSCHAHFSLGWRWCGEGRCLTHLEDGLRHFQWGREYDEMVATRPRSLKRWMNMEKWWRMASSYELWSWDFYLDHIIVAYCNLL